MPFVALERARATARLAGQGFRAIKGFSMALLNKRDPHEAASRLASWLAERMGSAHDVRVLDVEVPASSGLSNETILFDAAWRNEDGEWRRRLVARVEPTGPSVHPSYDLEREFRVMQALSAHGVVPVPTPLWIEVDPSVLGARFLVMERVDGRIPADDPPFTTGGWVVELDPVGQAALYGNGLEAMAAIHRTDWAALGIGVVDRPEYGPAGIEQQLRYWESTFEWAADGRDNPTIAAALAWVRDNRPPDRGLLALNWGDARVGNMIFSDDLSVAAVLDWEMVALANPELDLGWWLFITRYCTEGVGAPLPPGFLDRDATIERYHELTGHNVEHIDYYETFAAIRLAILYHRAGGLMLKAGLVPADSTMSVNNPITQLLAGMGDFPRPAGEAQSLIGKR
jgi:aminoglycoside phosphotransferase (APT) family kinase protein